MCALASAWAGLHLVTPSSAAIVVGQLTFVSLGFMVLAAASDAASNVIPPIRMQVRQQ